MTLFSSVTGPWRETSRCFFVEVSRVRLDDGAKIAATDADITEGTVLGG